MPEYKNQHYVPKHLLRGWTNNEKLPVYNLGNQQEYPPTSLSNLCSEDYFYGGPEMEQSMDGLERCHAEIINKIRSSMSFDVLDEMDILHFCVFVLLQRNRTKQQKQEVDDLIDNIAKEYLELQIESGELDPELSDGRNVLNTLDEFKITRENSLSYPMLHALTGVDLIIDLEVAVIVNRTDEKFVISDHPVVHDNPRFKDLFDRFLVGIQNRGLQIFVPLSSRIQIMLYDPAAYIVDYLNEEKRIVAATSEEVVNGLNDMQMINAFENIFYRTSNQEQKFIEVQQRLSKYIEEEKTLFKKMGPEEHDFDTKNEIIESGYHLPDYSPSLPFVTQRIDVRFTPERRPHIRQNHNEYVDELLEDARQQADATN
jgi:hypothetical protein